MSMEVERALYLLNFYDIRAWVWDGAEEAPDQEPQQLELTPAGISSNYLRCLEEISVAVSLKLRRCALGD